MDACNNCRHLIQKLSMAHKLATEVIEAESTIRKISCSDKNLLIIMERLSKQAHKLLEDNQKGLNKGDDHV